jgi:hypothetical protein
MTWGLVPLILTAANAFSVSYDGAIPEVRQFPAFSGYFDTPRTIQFPRVGDLAVLWKTNANFCCVQGDDAVENEVLRFAKDDKVFLRTGHPLGPLELTLLRSPF